ncbi:LptA/OstA family protein [Mangrovicella endophytica]|uniref:LptA/OstA family protein n=1 Tax=Mangrovicella endophytica TaxID=2066697 RepID=UPI000C9DFB30|nr:LptA/OstA family protein [Mangrovicella endophytica]
MTLQLRLRTCGLAILAAGTLAAAAPAMAQGFGKSFSGLQVSGDQPISIESNKLDVDDNNAVATFQGNVSVSQGQTMLKTGKLLVYYVKTAPKEGEKRTASAMPGGSDQIERLEASDKVYIKSQDQVATADKANFDMKTQIVVMTGDVVLSQGKNVASGCKLTIHMDTGLAQLNSDSCGGASRSSGRVKMMLTPQDQPQTN